MMNEGEAAYGLAERLFPIYRSITGEGVRKSFDIIRDYTSMDMEFRVFEIPTGTKVFDWEIPKEWEIKDAYIEDEHGRRIISFSDNCLHVMGYSAPVDMWVELEELKKYIYTQPDQPDVIPYVTSYYQEQFGFCMSENLKKSLQPGKYHMYIDSRLFEGSLTYAETVFKGKRDEEILFSTYSCHPSMANDNCSGLVLSAELIKYVRSLADRYYTYRFIFIPETIGAIAYIGGGIIWSI